MSIFRVGMRVRHTYSVGGVIPVGATGVITLIEVGHLTGDGPADCIVSWDGIFSPDIWSDFSQLEPILPPHEACDAEFKASLDELVRGLEVAA